MATGSPSFRLVTPDHPAGGRRAPREWDAAAAMLLAVGLVPIMGRLLLGHWPTWELGAGTAMALFALRQLLGVS